MKARLSSLPDWIRPNRYFRDRNHGRSFRRVRRQAEERVEVFRRLVQLAHPLERQRSVVVRVGEVGFLFQRSLERRGPAVPQSLDLLAARPS